MRRLAVLVAIVALLAAACQAASEQLTEQIIEQSAGGDADVDLDLDTGRVSVQTEDGSITVGGGEVPAGFPVPFPDGGSVQSVFQSDDGASVSMAYPRDRYEDLVAYYTDWVAGQGGEWSTSSFTNDTGDGDAIRGTSWWQGSDLNLGVTDCYAVGTDGLDSACVSVLTSE